MKIKNDQFALKKILTTILPIVFAVLLALALDAWYDNLKEERVVQTSLADIAADIGIYAGLNGVYALNAASFDTLTNQIKRYEAGEQVNFTFGFGRPEINSLAWQMARETGVAANFGRALYKDIAKVYNEFDRLQGLWNYNYQFKLSRDPNMDDYTLARHYHRQLRLIQARHQELMEKSAEFLEKYKDEGFTQPND